MPYNLRKRKLPEPEAPPARAISTAKKRRTKKEDASKSQQLETEVQPLESSTIAREKKVVRKKSPPLVSIPEAAPEKKDSKKKSPTPISIPDIALEKKVIRKKSPPPVVDKKSTERRQLSFGADSCGELGLGKIGVTKKLPTQVPIKEPVKQIACGPMHTLTLTESGQVYSYGCNDEGALGRSTDGDETVEATPTIVPVANKIIKISAGDSHSAVLTDKNEVFIWGNFRDEHGSVGLLPSCEGQATFEPIQILPDTKFKDIASGSNHMLALDTDGNVYSFGVGAQGQLGRLKPEELGENGNSHPITADNRELFLTPQKVSLKDVDPQRTFICDAIYAGNFSSFATNTDKKKNRLAGWGLNNYFQLGYKGQKGQLVQNFPRRSTFTCSTSMINVACGQHHTLFLTKTGRVYSAGRPEYGMLGLGKVDKEVCPAKFVESLGNSIVDISAGINTSFAVDCDGKLYAWGMGGTNLGLGEEDDLKIPTEVKNLADEKVLRVSAGGSFTSIIVE